MTRDRRTRLNNMIAERAPAAGMPPGKGTLTDDLEEDADTEEDVAEEVVTQPVKRSVFDSPFARDVVTEDPVDPADEAPTTKRRG